MKIVAVIVLFAILPFSSPAPVIYGNVQYVTGLPVSPTLTKLTFVPKSTPSASVDSLTTYLDYTSATNIWPGGWFTNTLTGGTYDVKFTASKTIAILMPTNGGPYTFDYCAQLATNAPVFSYPSVWGMISSFLRAGTNIKLTTNNPGIFESVTISTAGTNLNGWAQIPTNTLTPASAVTGTNIARGLVTLTNGVRTVVTPMAYITNIFLLTYNSIDSTHSDIYYNTVVAGTSFTIRSGNSADTNRVGYVIFLP